MIRGEASRLFKCFFISRCQHVIPISISKLSISSSSDTASSTLGKGMGEDERGTTGGNAKSQGVQFGGGEGATGEGDTVGLTLTIVVDARSEYVVARSEYVVARSEYVLSLSYSFGGIHAEAIRFEGIQMGFEAGTGVHAILTGVFVGVRGVCVGVRGVDFIDAK